MEAVQADALGDARGVDGVAAGLATTLAGSSVRSVWTTLTISTTKKSTGSEGSLPIDTKSSRDARLGCAPSISVACPPPSSALDTWLFCPLARTTQKSDPDTADNRALLASRGLGIRVSLSVGGLRDPARLATIRAVNAKS